jgi:predicted Zn-dependent protease
VRTVRLLLALGLATVATGSAAPGATAGNRPVYLVPLGGFSGSTLQKLAEDVHAKLGLSVSVRPGFALPRSAFDRVRRQYVADELLGPIEHIGTGDPRRPVVVGFTRADMYTRLKDWRYTFALRDGVASSVISSARMDDRFYGYRSNDRLLFSRLEKMLTKTLGVLYWGLPLSADPRSVLYDSILSLDDLDYMTRDFRAPSYTPAKELWIRRAGGACRSEQRAMGALLSREPLRTPPQLVWFFGRALPLELSLLSRLRGLGRPGQDQGATGLFLATLQGIVRSSEAAYARIRAKWDPVLFQNWERQSESLGFEAKSYALEAGSKECAAII